MGLPILPRGRSAKTSGCTTMGSSLLLMTISLGLSAITAPVVASSLDRADLGAGHSSAALLRAPPVIGFAFGEEAAQRTREPSGLSSSGSIGDSQRAYLNRWLLCTPRYRTYRRSLGNFQPYRGGSRSLCQTGK
jgi:hypothetical protein